MNCEMCGVITEVLFQVNIESVNMNVCKECAKYGQIIKKVRTKQEEKTFEKQEIVRKKKEEESIFLITPNYSSLIKKGREKKGLKQEQLAKILKEKESTIHNIESGRLEPSIRLAEKFERFFGIKLIDQINAQDTPTSTQNKENSKELTIGDVIKIKSRK